MKEIRILQLKREMHRDKGFERYDYIIEEFGKVDLTDYNEVYVSARKDDYTLDDAFYEFNVNHPIGFKGHSLSVSDIVVMDNKISYVDSFGFKTL